MLKTTNYNYTGNYYDMYGVYIIYFLLYIKNKEIIVVCSFGYFYMREINDLPLTTMWLQHNYIAITL